MKINKEKLKELSKKSILEEMLKKEADMLEKEIAAHKKRSVILSAFISLFLWLCIGIYLKNPLLSLGIALLLGVVIFIFIFQEPMVKRAKRAKKVESQLPLFLTKLIFEIKSGKTFLTALNDLTLNNKNKIGNKKMNEVEEEFAKVVSDINKGCSLSEAFERMNKRLGSTNIKRATSNLFGIYTNGTKDTIGIKKLVSELLLKQRIESKEFSGKMVVYALVFIAISAIVPAMFQSFMLIGSYFMKMQINGITAFGISTLLFPLIDVAILSMINSKTPIFLKGGE